MKYKERFFMPPWSSAPWLWIGLIFILVCAVFDISLSVFYKLRKSKNKIVCFIVDTFLRVLEKIKNRRGKKTKSSPV